MALTGREVAEGLARVMEAVGTTVDLREILYRLVEVSVAATGADRAAVLLLEDGHLVPTAVAGRRVNRELFRTFKQMPAIRVDEVDDRVRMVWGSDLVVIDDARASAAVPDGWVEAFGTTSLVIAPLTSADGLAGVLAVDHTNAYEYDDTELATLRAISHAARVAIANAALRTRLAHTVKSHDELLDAILVMDEASDVPDVLETIAKAANSLFPGCSCAIAPADTSAEPVPPQSLPRGAHRTVFPIGDGGRQLGYLTVTGADPISTDHLATLDAFARHASVAITRAREMASVRAKVKTLELVQGLAATTAGPQALPVVLRRVNEELCRGLGLECVDVALRDRRDAAVFDARRLERSEGALLARFGAGDQGDAVAVDPDGLFAVAVHVNGSAAGLLFVRVLASVSGLAGEALELVTTIASALGDGVARARLKQALREATQRLVRDGGRADVAEQLAERLRRNLEAIDDLLAATDPEAGACRVHEIVSESLLEIHAASRAGRDLDVRHDGLESVLRETLAWFTKRSGTSTNLRIEGRRSRLPDVVEQAVHAVLFDALAFIADAARATTVTVTLRYGDPVTLTIRDDGIGLSQRAGSAGRQGVHHGVGAIRADLAALGGDLSVEAAGPRGVRLIARVPRHAPSSVRAAGIGVVVPMRAD